MSLAAEEEEEKEEREGVREKIQDREGVSARVG